MRTVPALGLFSWVSTMTVGPTSPRTDSNTPVLTLHSLWSSRRIAEGSKCLLPQGAWVHWLLEKMPVRPLRLVVTPEVSLTIPPQASPGLRASLPEQRPWKENQVCTAWGPVEGGWVGYPWPIAPALAIVFP